MSKPFDEYSKAKILSKGPVPRVTPKPDPPSLPSIEKPKVIPRKGPSNAWLHFGIISLFLGTIALIYFAPLYQAHILETSKQESIEPKVIVKWRTKYITKTKWKTRYRTRGKGKTVYVESPRLLHEYRYCKENLSTAYERIKRLTIL